jgi:2-polyprenyl-3-methyl-5-hydroxy-6-metoxy-1,4-benzoquinol methylase
MISSKLSDMLAQRRMREAIYCTAEFWDLKAANLDGHAVSMWPNNNLNRLYHDEQLRILATWLPDVRGKSALDLGCGTGRLSRWLAERGASVVGIDFSEKSVVIASQQGPQGNPTYRTQSMFDLEDRDCYDVIVSWGSITVACRDAAEVRQVMANLRRAARPGGEIVLLEPIHKGFLHRVLALDVSEFEAIMLETGFQILSEAPMHFWPARLALAFFTLPSWLTSSTYWIGQLIMRVPGFRRMGDYTAIRAAATCKKLDPNHLPLGARGRHASTMQCV